MKKSSEAELFNVTFYNVFYSPVVDISYFLHSSVLPGTNVVKLFGLVFYALLQ